MKKNTSKKLTAKTSPIPAKKKRKEPSIEEIDIEAQEYFKVMEREDAENIEAIVEARQIDALLAAARAGAKEGAAASVAHNLPRVYAEAANMDADELTEKYITKKHRKPGAGRPRTKDIGDQQVRDVLALAEDKKKHFKTKLDFSSYVVRNMKPGQYDNPYTKARDLDKAVDRYLARHHIPDPFKLNGSNQKSTRRTPSPPSAN